jgi:biopolymer transport protein ExbB
MDSSIWDLMSSGGYAMWIIVAFSVIALGVAIERAVAQWQFTTKARVLGAAVAKCLGRGAVDEARSACDRSQSPLADIYVVGFNRAGKASTDKVVAATHRERQRVAQDLRVRLWILATVGATAPFVGLFGTVVGIMQAMSGFEGVEEVTFSMVAGPLSEALIVTAAGILVAVEAVIFYNYFNQRAGRIAVEMKLFTDEFLESLLDESVISKVKDGKVKGDDDGGGREAA